jgi:hypothetical protein
MRTEPTTVNELGLHEQKGISLGNTALHTGIDGQPVLREPKSQKKFMNTRTGANQGRN